MIQGATRLVAIVGSPVKQVKMPTNLNRHFAEQGQDMAMVPFDVPPEGLGHFIAMLRHARNMAGSVVTIPHKQAFSQQLDGISDRARALGAVNVVRREADGSLHGDHVDGLGFLNAARAHGFLARGKTVLLAGAGGAGSAIAYALCEAGVAELCLLDPAAGRVDTVLATLSSAFPAVRLTRGAASLAAFDMVINASSVGMNPTDPMPLSAEQLDTLAAHTLVADAITSPPITPLLAFAQARGCRIQTGADMSLASMEFLGSFLKIMPEVDPLAVISAPLP